MYMAKKAGCFGWLFFPRDHPSMPDWTRKIVMFPILLCSATSVKLTISYDFLRKSRGQWLGMKSIVPLVRNRPWRSLHIIFWIKSLISTLELEKKEWRGSSVRRIHCGFKPRLPKLLFFRGELSGFGKSLALGKSVNCASEAKANGFGNRLSRQRAKPPWTTIFASNSGVNPEAADTPLEYETSTCRRLLSNNRTASVPFRNY